MNDLAQRLLKSAFLPNNSFNLDDPEVKALCFTKAVLDTATPINRQLASGFHIMSWFIDNYWRKQTRILRIKDVLRLENQLLDCSTTNKFKIRLQPRTCSHLM